MEIKNLIIYGSMGGWTNFESDVFLPYLKDKIHAIKIFYKIKKLQKYLEKEGSNSINYVLPLTDNHCKEINDANIMALIPNSEVLHIFYNKHVFSDYVKKNNLSKYYPQVFIGPNVNKQLVVVKPNFGGGSTCVYFTELNKLKKEDFKNNIVQEYINSHLEFAGYFVADKGEIIHSFGYYREYPENTPYIKAINDTSVQKRTHIDKEYVKIIEKFVKPVFYTGAFCVDFKLAKNTLIVLEINPRLGASLSYPENIKDGADVIGNLIDIYKDKFKITKNDDTDKSI
jgi:predicted ATP-grasp superfamily ATP-dependent carboligase